MVSNEMVLRLCIGYFDTGFVEELSYIFVDRLLNALQYHLIFVLKKHTMFAVSFSLTGIFLKFFGQSLC